MPTALVVSALQFGQLPMRQRCLHMSEFEIAIDTIFGDPLSDNIMPAPSQLPHIVCRFVPKRAAKLALHSFVTRQATSDLTAIAPRSTPTNLVGLAEHNTQAAFCELKRSCHAGETAANNGDVSGDI